MRSLPLPRCALPPLLFRDEAELPEAMPAGDPFLFLACSRKTENKKISVGMGSVPFENEYAL
jgi:hypothetical protein